MQKGGRSQRKWLISRILVGGNFTKGLTGAGGSPTLPLVRSGRRADGREALPPVVHGGLAADDRC